MNDFIDSQRVAGDPSNRDSSNSVPDSAEEIPQFGAVDIVEAFTAMRHEWRGQSRESRAVAEQIQAASARLQEIEATLLAGLRENGPSPSETFEARGLVQLIIDTDHQLSRAAAAIGLWEENQQQRERDEQQALDECLAAMGLVARWWARPLLALLAGQSSARRSGRQSPATEGLVMLLERLRRAMQDRGIERIDVLGQPFDAAIMCAVGTTHTQEYRPGDVAEQLSPAYRWRGQVIRFADVRVARAET